MKTTFKFVGIILLSFLLSLMPTDGKSIITRESITNYSIELFGISLAIIALLFTVLDRYSEKLDATKKEQFSQNTFPVIKEIGDNTIAILILIIFMFVCDILWLPIQSLKFLSFMDVERFTLLLPLIFLLVLTVDITGSIIKLIHGLISINNTTNIDNIVPTEQELDLISISRKLDNKHFHELLEYIRTLIIKQKIDKKD